MDIVSLSDAKANGLRFYFTGKPCGHGHIAERVTSNSACRECSRSYWKNNPDKLRGYVAKYKDRRREAFRASYRSDPEKYRTRRKASYVRNRALILEKKRADDAAKRAERAASGKLLWRKPRLSPIWTKQELLERRRSNRAATHDKRLEYDRSWRKRNRDKRVEQARKLRAANPEKINAQARARHALKKGAINAKVRAWRQAHPEWRERQREKRKLRMNRERVLALAWRRANPDKVRAVAHNRRSRKLKAAGTFTKADIAALFKLQKGKCAYFGFCKMHIKDYYEVDHIVALASGGTNAPSNLQLLCMACNRTKADKDPIRHARELGMLL